MSAYFPPVCQSWQRLPGRNDPVLSLPGEEREGGNEFPAGIGAGQEQAAVYEVSISEWERALLEHEEESQEPGPWPASDGATEQWGETIRLRFYRDHSRSRVGRHFFELLTYF